jgi:hypothetical protein
MPPELAQIGTFKQLGVLFLAGTKVTDAGLVSLQRLDKLRYLEVRGTLVTESGIADLKQKLPKLEVKR